MGIVAQRLVAGLTAATEGHASVLKQGLAQRAFYVDVAPDVQRTVHADGDNILLRYGFLSPPYLRSNCSAPVGQCITTSATRSALACSGRTHGSNTSGKPRTRKVAQVGDLVAATTAADFVGSRGLLVYAARITDKLTMADYRDWAAAECPGKLPARGEAGRKPAEGW